MFFIIFRLTFLGALIGSFACAPQTSSKDKGQIRNKNTESMSENGGEVGIDDGSNIAVPPGAVAIGTEVTIQKVADDPAFDVGSESASSTVEIKAFGQDGLPVEQASQPMTVALSIDAGTNLALTASEDDMCVLLKTLSGKQIIWRRALLTIETGKKVSLQSLYFGKYKAVYCGSNSVAGFDEADTVGAAGGEQVAFSMTVKPNQFPDTTHDKYCFVVARMKDKSQCDKDTEDDESCGGIAVLGAAEGAKSDASLNLSASVNQSSIVDGYEYITFLILLEATETCEAKVGASLDKIGVGNAQAVFAYAYAKTDVQSGLSGTIGAGEFFNLDKVSVELGSFPNQPAFDEPIVCVDVDGEMSKSMHLVSFAGGKIGSAATRSFLAAVPANSKIDSLTMRVGASCQLFETDFSTVDLTTGKPYDFETQLSSGQTIVAKPVKLNITSNTNSLAGKKGCLFVNVPNSTSGSGRLGQLAMSFDQPLYKIFLPYLTTEIHQITGEPKYDMEIIVLNTGATCQNAHEATSQLLAPISLKGKALTESIDITLP